MPAIPAAAPPTNPAPAARANFPFFPPNNLLDFVPPKILVFP